MFDYFWIHDDPPPDRLVAELADRQARWLVAGGIDGRYRAERLLSDLRTATKHHTGPYAEQLVDAVQAVHVAVTGDTADGPARQVRDGNLSAVAALWAQHGFDTTDWPHMDDVTPRDLPDLHAVATDDLVGAEVLVRQHGGQTVEGRLLSTGNDRLLLLTRTDEQVQLETLAIIPAATVLSVGLFTELLPGTFLDQLDGFDR